MTTVEGAAPAGEGVVRTFCRLCEVGCGLVAHVEDGRLVRLRPDHDHPVTAGFACSKGLRGVDVHADPARLRRPQRRVDGGFIDTTWEDAIAEVAERVEAAIAEHGPRAVGLYLGNPNAFNAMGSGTAFLLPALLGSDRLFSAATQDCSNKYAVAELLYGYPMANAIPDVERTELLLVIGSNPRVSKSSFFSVPDPVKVLRCVRDRGGRVVFVNPRAIEPDIGPTLQVRPDTDAYLLAALVHEVHRIAGFRLGALEGRVEGLDEVAAYVAPFSPAAVADVVGVPAEAIAALARDFVEADGASIHASTGLNMGRQGALAYWLVQVLLLVTGNLDRPGGSYFAARGLSVPPSPVDRSASSFEPSPAGPFRRAVGMMPATALPELVEDPDEPLRVLFVVAGNPALTVGGGDRMAEALASLDLLVSIDLYRNATGELADVVLPATSQYEREDLNIFAQGLQGRPFVQWTPAVVAAEDGPRQEWQIVGQLLQAMGREPLLDPATEDPLPLLFDGVLEPADISVGKLRAAGGVLTLPEPGPGSSTQRLGLTGPIECVPEALRPTLERGVELFEALRAEDPSLLKLITRRTRDDINSTLANLPARGETADTNPLWLHPDDGAALDLPEGATAVVSNEWGTIEAPVRHDPTLRPGVVAMTHGFGNAATSGMPVAQRRAGVNVNALAPRGAGSFDPVSGMAQLTGIGVRVVPARQSGGPRPAEEMP